MGRLRQPQMRSVFRLDNPNIGFIDAIVNNPGRRRGICSNPERSCRWLNSWLNWLKPWPGWPTVFVRWLAQFNRMGRRLAAHSFLWWAEPKIQCYSDCCFFTISMNSPVRTLRYISASAWRSRSREFLYFCGIEYLWLQLMHSIWRNVLLFVISPLHFGQRGFGGIQNWFPFHLQIQVRSSQLSVI